MDVRKGIRNATIVAGIGVGGWIGYETGKDMPNIIARIKDPVAAELSEPLDENERLGAIGAAVFAVALPGSFLALRRFAHDVASDYYDQQ